MQPARVLSGMHPDSTKYKICSDVSHHKVHLAGKQQPLRFLPGSIDDFCEKVEAVCEPGNRSIYTSPSFCYLQSRLTGKSRMLLAKKRGIFSLYFGCRTPLKNSTADRTEQVGVKKSAIGDFFQWLSKGRHHLETASVLKRMVCMFCEQILTKKLPAGGYHEEQIFPDGLESVLSYQLPQDPLTLFHQIRTLTKPDTGRVILAFDDAASLLKMKSTVYYGDGAKMKAARVNLLRWIRYCVSTEVSGDFFWHCPVVFCDSSPEIDKTDPRRHGECVSLGREPPRVFMPLILHDAFDLFMDKVAETAFEVNTKMAWTDHVRSPRYLIELAYYGRPAWGAMTCALLEQEKMNYFSALTQFMEVVYKTAEYTYMDMFDSSKNIRTNMIKQHVNKDPNMEVVDKRTTRRIREVSTVWILASVFGVFDIHSTNLNLWIAKRCMSELLALDMDGRVCFAAFPSEPIVASFASEWFSKEKGIEGPMSRTVIKEAIEFHKHGIISLDNESAFVVQTFLLLAASKSPVTEGVLWKEAVDDSSLHACLPRQARPFLTKLVGDQILTKLNMVNDLINGSIIFSHFASVDMDDLVEELGQMGYQQAAPLDRKNYQQLSSYLDAVQLALTVGRLAGRNAAGIVAEPWNGIDLLCPVVCNNGQLGCILVSICHEGSDKEDTLDSALVDLAHIDASMLLAAPHPAPKVALPAIGLVFKNVSGEHSVSFKQLGNAVRVTVTGVNPWLASFLGADCLGAMASIWGSDLI